MINKAAILSKYSHDPSICIFTSLRTFLSLVGIIELEPKVHCSSTKNVHETVHASQTQGSHHTHKSCTYNPGRHLVKADLEWGMHSCT